MISAFVPAAALAAALIAVGACALLFPAFLAGRYGVPVADAAGTAYVRATGVRDVALGSLLGGIVAERAMATLALFCIVAIAVSLGDLLIVRRFNAGRFVVAYLAHAAGAAAFAATLLLVIAS